MKNVATNNLVEVPHSKHAISLENTFSILDSNRQHEDQHLVKVSNVDDDRLIYQTDASNGIATEFNVNLRNRSMDNALEIVNDIINSDKHDDNAEKHDALRISQTQMKDKAKETQDKYAE